MSIPGLGQIPVQVEVSSTRTISLGPACEWRFQVPHGSSLIVKLLSGTAERDGTELPLRNAYTISGARSKILTWHGCELEIDGRCEEDSVARYANPAANPANAHVNLHAQLNELRTTAGRQRREGPRVLVAGPASVGKTTLVRTLASYATRQGYQPLVVNVDPSEGMLSLPGTLSAGVFATVMDPQAADAWGSTPTSGPSTIPVKLPLVMYFGRKAPEDDGETYKRLTSRLADATSGRLSEDADVKTAGVIVDSAAVEETSKEGVDLLAHVVEEFSVNIIVVLGSTGLEADLSKRFASEKTSLGEPITVVALDKSDGAVERSESFVQQCREAAIKEYFYGDSRRTLSPQIQQVDFGSLVIYKYPYYADYDETLAREQPSSRMENWTLAVMHASVKDPPETVASASVMGFVYVADVDEERQKLRLLAPVGGRLGERPLVWGQWPEPYINLLG